MTVVARRIASVPRRTSVQTWQRVIELVTSPGSKASAELASITALAAMLIADEYAKEAAITVSGGGPLVRLYTLHGDDAIEYDEAEEAELAFDPTETDTWRLSLPAAGADVAIARAAVAACSHIDVRDLEAAADSSVTRDPIPPTRLVIDIEELERL